MDDALLSLLIAESVNAPSAARRIAALALVLAIRRGGEDNGASVQRLLTQVSREEGAEILALCELYGIPKIPVAAGPPDF